MELVEQKRVVPPLQRHLQLETDFFCHQCHYNLHGQIVTRDDRLDMLVCRCPECGRFHPAALGVSATRPWLARVGVLAAGLLVVVWLGLTVAAGFSIGIGPYAHLETYTTHGNYTYSGQVERLVRPEPYPQGYENWNYRNSWKIGVGFTAGGAFLLGLVYAVMMWHIPPSTLRRSALFPIIVAFFVYWIWWANYNIDSIHGWSLWVVTKYSLLAIVLMMAGLRFGRPIARFAVRMIVPPRLRQHLHFLWSCDGKTPPKIVSDVDGALA